MFGRKPKSTLQELYHRLFEREAKIRMMIYALESGNSVECERIGREWKI